MTVERKRWRAWVSYGTGPMTSYEGGINTSAPPSGNSLQIAMVYELVDSAGTLITAGQNLINETITEAQEFQNIGMTAEYVNDTPGFPQNFVYEARVRMTLTAVGTWDITLGIPSALEYTTAVYNNDGQGAFAMGATIDGDTGSVSMSNIGGAGGEGAQGASSDAGQTFTMSDEVIEILFSLDLAIEGTRSGFVDTAYALVNLTGTPQE